MVAMSPNLPSSPSSRPPAPLARAFYQRPTVDVAVDLLGKLLVRRTDEGVVSVRLTEVEAYLGEDDPACHTIRGRRTPRVEAMWGEAGYAYVYLIYGLHHCLNVVTVGRGSPEAILVRGAVPVSGLALMRERRGMAVPDRHLLDGPGKLCQALAVDRQEDGVDLCSQTGGMWLAEDGTEIREREIRRGPRVGVDSAGEAAGWLLRWQWTAR
jgi:DNA-3-methyladenine glycosylase